MIFTNFYLLLTYIAIIKWKMDKVGVFMNLSKEQKKAVFHVKGPALVLAVPGAGKTTVLIHRTANLILNHNVSPEKILSITFSRASARDMENRFKSLYGDISNIPVGFSTIHSFSYGLIREYAFKNRIRYTLIEDENKELNKFKLLKSIYYSINKKHITEERLETLLNSIGYIKNMLLSPEEFLSNNKIDIKNFEHIFKAYEDYKRANRLLDFDDMLTLALDILHRDKGILEKYRNRYEYIQVDEGQDTSKVQLEIIKTVAHPRNNLFIVADDDQSIYSFRGAYPKGLLDFNKVYKDGKIFFMERNYRSSKNIVTVCNKFIKKNKLRYNKDIITENPLCEPINIVKVNSMAKQYEFIVEELKRHNKYEDTAILYRNNISSIGIIEYLERNSIPFYIKDIKLKFFNHWLIEDVVYFFLLAKDNTNIEAFENIYYKMDGFISKNQLHFVKANGRGQSVFDTLLDIPGINEFYRKNFLNLKLNFKKLSKMKPYDGICLIEKTIGYGDYLKENSMKFGYIFDSLEDLLGYLKIIAKPLNSIDELLLRLKYLNHLISRSHRMKKGVTLSTIHSAKGLEFERVYMIDLIDGEFPTATSIDEFNRGKIQQLEEERRLFYVGMTRAKRHLTLITLDSKNDRKTKPSVFLRELENLKF